MQGSCENVSVTPVRDGVRLRSGGLAELPPAGIDDLAMRCCQAANPRHDIDPFHTAFVVRAQFKHLEAYQQRTAGKPWCAVGQFTMDPQGMDVVHAGARTFPLGARVRAVALDRVIEDVPRLR